MPDKSKKCMLSVVLTVMFFLISVSSFAGISEKSGSFNLEIKNNRIDIHAKNADFKKILKELENKTGIKVNIIGEVQDKRVTLSINSLPLYGVGTLLSKMSLKNYSVVYDHTSAALAVYILPEGHDISSYIKDKTVISRASFSKGENAAHIKNREIVTIEQGRGKFLDIPEIYL